ncbi:murein biosynthesis integral membrane protein MurJ [Streptacidiphilus sp. PB12-B1b]|uniref:murein biosynthesis integral membrane protein MurJ n=1 Tax=Streptacidiphilus sp. PB12-B1b TaxID=2705012 RepID=UPI0015F83226|nr:murein biosynthesis integral membrane protein MurJ [Streptacidiphilus sp. PB12-B1b]QMU79886.1 murein biosynthesis integral membrane protein MurJ [Streptacidiphilus sp. PB12-B1b]
MSAPRDGRTQRGRGGRTPEPGTPPGPEGGVDPYLDETYARDPYAQDPYGHDAYNQPYQPEGFGPSGYGGQQGYAAQAPAQSPAQAPYGQPGYGPQGFAAYEANAYPQQTQPQPQAQAPQQQAQPQAQPPQQYGQQQPPAGYQAPYDQNAYGGQQQPQQYATPQYDGQPYDNGQPYSTAPGAGAAYGTDPGAPTEYVGVDELVSRAGRSGQEQPPDADPYGFLFRDGGNQAEPNPAAYPPGMYGEAGGDAAMELTNTMPLFRVSAEALGAASADTTAEPDQEQKGGGKAGSLLSSSAIMAAGTLVSRGTGFVRTMVITFAIGVGTMGDAYNVANTLPTLLYILVGGGALNAVFVPQLVRSMKNDEDGGEAYASRLLTLVVVGLGGVVFATVLAAPLLVRLVSDSIMRNPESASVTVSLARYCLPTIFFMGVHVVMGQVLNARGKFGAMMWTPVLNNVVVIFTFGMYAWVYGPFTHTKVTPETISPEGVHLLGIGTLLGLSVQALSMIPYLRAAGFKFRPRFDWRGHGLGHAAKLARWTFLFVLANQAGYLVVTQLATAAGNASGTNGAGLSAYSNALLIWQLPQAVITVSVMSAVLPRISRSAADGDAVSVRDDLSYGLRTSAVAIVPAAFIFLALGPVIGSVLYGFGGRTQGTSVGWMLSAFGLGLIPYSAQYVLLRGFYAYEDTRTPFYNTVWVAASQAVLSGVCYLALPARWAVTGMAFAYGVSYLIGLVVALPRLKRRIGDLDGPRIKRTYSKLIGASIIPAVVAFGCSTAVASASGGGFFGDVAALIVGMVLQLGLFVVITKRMHIEEMDSLIGMVRRKIGR